MSIFSAIGNALSSGYHDVFGGGQSDDQKKKQQQQQQAAQAAAQAQRNVTPVKNNAAPNPTPVAPTSMFSTTPLQKVNAPATGVGGQPVVDASTLVKAANVPKPAPVVAPVASPHASILHDITHNDITDLPKNAASVAAGTALGTLRAGEGLVSGTLQLPSAAAHLGDAISKKINPPHVAVPYANPPPDPFTQALDKATNFVTVPVDKLQKATDDASKAFGKPASQVYKAAQVAANVATVVPGAEAALSKIPGVASKLGGVGDAIEAQRGVSTLRKAIPSPAADVAPANEVSDGVQTVNPNHDADVIAQSPNSPVNRPEPPAPDVPVEAPVVTPPEPVAAPVAAPAAAPAEVQVPSVKASRTMALGKPGVRGSSTDIYHTDDPQLDQIMRSSIIAAKGTAKSADEHAGALTDAGLKPADIQAIRDYAVKNANTTGEVDSKGLSDFIKGRITPASADNNTVAAASTGARPEADLQAQIEQAHNSGDTAKTTELVNQLPAEMQPAMRSALSLPEAEAAPAGVAGQPVRADAGRLRTAAVEQLKKVGANVDAAGSTHPINGNPELTQAGKAAVEPLTDEQLLTRYHGEPTFHGSADVAEGLASMQRLAKLSAAGNTDADAAIGNILNASAKEISSGARTTNYAKEFYDNLPKPAKVKYLINNMDKIRSAFNETRGLKPGDGKFLPMIGDDPALGKVVEANIDHFLSKDEAVRGSLSDIENQAEQNKSSIAAGGADNRAIAKDGSRLNKEYKAAGLALQKNTADMGRYYDTIMPTRIATQTKLGDLGRTLMLSSPTGRANDVITTTINSGHRLLTQIPESVMGKAANAIGGNDGKYLSTLPSPRAIVRGTRFGLTKTRARFAGDLSNGDISSLTKTDTGSGKGGLLSRGDNSRLSKITAPLHKVVRSATEIATDVSEGIKEAQIQRLASQQGKALGYKGGELKAYTANATAVPTKEMTAAGDQLRDEVNNMQDNPITSGLENISKGLAKTPVVGEQLKNLTLPFTRWTGGQMWNNAVDNNVLGNVVKAGKAAYKGDRQGVITNLSRLGVNSTLALTAGYQLAKSGVIVHSNAEGYNDDGAYLHVDGRYVPASFLGFFAPGLILGASTYEATSGKNSGKPILSQIVNTAAKTFKNTAAASGAASLTGENNPVISALQNRRETGDKAAGAAIAGQVAGQYIPAAGNDANAILNNGLQVKGVGIPDYNNPNHEASLTKAEKGGLTPTGKKSTAKDVGKTTVNQLINKVPFASQHLPRKTGVAAPDLVDRTDRGDRDTGAELLKKATAKNAADASAADLKAGVPDPTATYTQGDSFANAVENRIEGHHYDQAIKGLQQQLSIKQKAKDNTTKATQPIKDQITQVKVLKSGNYDPSIRDLYKSTSIGEWRNLGDSNSDNYDPTTYQKLYQYDTDLAKVGISGSSVKKTDNKYTAKTSKAGSGGGSSSSKAALKNITSNTLGTLPNIANFSMGSLSPQKITDAKAQIPTIQDIPANQLIKKRTISVKVGVA